MTPHEAVNRYSGLVYTIANRFRRFCQHVAHFDFDDLVQIGFVGLIKGASRHDPSFGLAPSTYLAIWIQGEILRFLRDHLTSIKMSRKHSLDDKYAIGIAISLHTPTTVDNEKHELMALIPVDGDYTEIHVLDIIDRNFGEKQRKAFHLYVWGATQGEIGREIGVSQVTVGRYLAKIRDVLAKEVTSP